MTEISITVPVTMREGEEIRFAAGPGFLRIDVRTSGRDRALSDAIRAAQSAGILSEDEARTKQLLLGTQVGRSELITADPTSRIPFADLVGRAVARCLSEVRERANAEGISK